MKQLGRCEWTAMTMAAEDAFSAQVGQVLAFRLHNHNLAQRLPARLLGEAAAACGIQNSPPGSALISLNARLSGLDPAGFHKSLAVDKTLLQMWSLRAAPYIFPAVDLHTFTTGLMPDDDEALGYFIGGGLPHLKMFGLSAAEIVSHAASVLAEVLQDRILTKDELGIQLARQVSRFLPAEKLGLWNTPDGLRSNTYGETIVRFAMAILALRGMLSIASQSEPPTKLALTTDLAVNMPALADERQARAELARRYLHCYGPSMPGHFAEWAGIAPAQAGRTWELVASELLPVKFMGRRTWLLESDRQRLLDPPAAEGVRFLPPHDPYLALRDRVTLEPDPKLQRLLWRSAGNPGVVLAGGRPAGAWRSKKTANRLKLSIQWFQPIGAGLVGLVEF